MANTSATGGFLASSPVQNITGLEDVLHDLIAGITGLPGKYVRPANQVGGIKVPGADTNWCSFDIRQIAAGMPEITHMPGSPDVAGVNGCDRLVTHKTLQLFVSFYGPEAAMLASALVDGIRIEQNRYILRKNNLGFVRAGELISLPENKQAKWLARTDVTLTFNWQLTRYYAVQNITSTIGNIVANKQDVPAVNIDVLE